MGWLPNGLEFLSGFPERIRRKRIIVTLQAVFDDSGTKGMGRFMTIAGLFGEAEAIALLATEWDRHLRASHPGALQCFKLDDARTLNSDGCFAHWQRHNADAKIQQMAKVIDRCDLTIIGGVLDLNAYQSVFREWESTGHHAFSQPYMMLLDNALWIASDEAVKRGYTGRLEVVFDEHTKFAPIVLSRYQSLRALIAESDTTRAAVMPSQPRFIDDRAFVALQAADLVAGYARLSSEEDRWLLGLGPLFPTLRDGARLRPIDETAMLRYRDSVER